MTTALFSVRKLFERLALSGGVVDNAWAQQLFGWPAAFLVQSVVHLIAVKVKATALVAGVTYPGNILLSVELLSFCIYQRHINVKLHFI